MCFESYLLESRSHGGADLLVSRMEEQICVLAVACVYHALIETEEEGQNAFDTGGKFGKSSLAFLNKLISRASRFASVNASVHCTFGKRVNASVNASFNASVNSSKRYSKRLLTLIQN